MYLPPLFPTLLRTTGAGLSYNIGRIAAAIPIERVIAIWAAFHRRRSGGARARRGRVGLFAGTVLAGAAVAIAQTAVPILLRTRFGGHTGSLTGAFSMAAGSASR